MKILVLCPGSFTAGLDSAERGESRWSQNYAKMLARAGHEVYAASMGSRAEQTHYGVRLVNELDCHKYAPYDLYIDSSWWDKKQPYAAATQYVCLKWSLEDYTREYDFPDNFHLAYPYPSHMHEFYVDQANGKDDTFALPTMFGIEFPEPTWNKEHVFLPGKVDTNRDYKRFMPAIIEFLNQHPVDGCSATFFKEEFHGFTPRPGSHLYELRPYNEVFQSMGNSKLSLPVLNPGCVIEAAFAGCPSIFWEEGGFYNPLARNMGVLIENNAEPEVFTEIATEMMTNKKRHWEVTRVTQDYFSCHKYDVAMKYFDMMIETIF